MNWYENPLSLKILQSKYLHEGETSAEDLLNRVSSIFSNEDLKKKVYRLMKEGNFFPGGRSLYGAGSKGKFNATMSNCYIMPCPEDSLESIYDSNKLISQIFKSGGGIGINLSKLRPEGAKTNNAARTSTGAVSFVNLFNSTGEIIGFHGRRGATLVGLDISHPDIEKFVDLRKDHDLKAMNISCIINKEFMEAVKNDTDYTLHFHVDATGEDINKTIKAKELWDKICYMNWDYGDPGMLFIDSIRENNLQSKNPKFHIDICNPCAEYTGPAFNSCNLGSMNLYNYVSDKFSDNPVFEWDKFRTDVSVAVEALDEILDYGYDMQPLDQNREIITRWRAIGLGFFGYADALIAMGLKYGEKDAIKFAEDICRCMLLTALTTSAELAKRKGKFKYYNKKYVLSSNLMKRVKQESPVVYELVEKYGLRNAQLLSIAPTGSLSLLAGSLSSGIEPIFKALSYDRSTHGLEDQNVSFTVTDRAIAELLEYHGIKNITIEELKEKFDYVVETADIDKFKRVDTQASMQKWNDNAISSTITLKHDATIEDISDIYMYAYEKGLKGITVFRNGCKRADILGVSGKSEQAKLIDSLEEICSKLEFSKMNEKDINRIQSIANKIAPNIIEKPTASVTLYDENLNQVEPIGRKGKYRLEGATYRQRTACVKALYVTVNRDGDNIFEVFTNKAIHGCSANIAAITRLVSLALRSGVKIEKVIEELEANSCQACTSIIKKEGRGTQGIDYISQSCPHAIAQSLREELEAIKRKNTILDITNRTLDKINKACDTIIKYKEKDEDIEMLECPKCGHKTLIPTGNCVTCTNPECGYSKCD